MKKGIYRTSYGNAAYVSETGKAFDLDMGEYIPLSEVDLDQWIREAEPEDEPDEPEDEYPY